MKRVAVVGLGKMGLLHAALLNTFSEIQLVALCEKSFLVRRFGGKAFNGINMVKDISNLADLGLDAVYVTTPPQTHYAIVKSIYSGKIAQNVFVEKPLAMNYDESKELCGLADDYKVNMVGYSRRFSVTFRKAKEILDEGVLGKLFRFEGHAYSSDLLGVKRPSETLLKVGVLRDLGCHIIDIARWFLGSFEVDRAEIESESGDTYFKVFWFDGLVGEFRSSWQKEGLRFPEMELRIFGSKGEITVNDDKVEVKTGVGKPYLWYKHDLDDNVPFFLGGAEYFREDEAFAKAMSAGCSIEPDFQSAIEVDRLIGEVERKAKGK